MIYNEKKAGAGEGNRTLVYSLGSCRSTIELRPLFVSGAFIRSGLSLQQKNMKDIFCLIILVLRYKNECYGRRWLRGLYVFCFIV
ncbi:hypothetical protein MTBPR1_50097 [Candidatus Terasakiella magnetica]|uniref:Uncharacterized protein n=1 Tax=Candidatus Terasakiella magnetica TaxID=1867952 RepID=A0A1C3RJ94_9PROT|nr:hypothetical protein MTBPR1_50097 [Candidatus Terasakiella magnetica]